MFEGLEPPVVERLCSLAKSMKTLNDKDLKILQEALEDPRWGHKALTKAVLSRGFKTNEKALAAHRKGACICLKS